MPDEQTEVYNVFFEVFLLWLSFIDNNIPVWRLSSCAFIFRSDCPPVRLWGPLPERLSSCGVIFHWGCFLHSKVRGDVKISINFSLYQAIWNTFYFFKTTSLYGKYSERVAKSQCYIFIWLVNTLTFIFKKWTT